MTSKPTSTESKAAESAAAVEPLPDGLVDNLALDGKRDEQFPDRIQTHISHLFLSADRVYKIRKAVRFSFLSFATRRERNEDCLREVRLNRRLAPDVYLGVAPLLQHGEGWVVGEVAEELANEGAEAPEHCVVMKRLRDGGDAQRLVERGELGKAHIDAIAHRVAAFHATHRLARPAPWSAEAWRARTEAPVIENLRTIEDSAPDPALVERARAMRVRSAAVLEALQGALETRRREGHAVDGHGDLQLAHVWFDGPADQPSIIDCTEFNEDFRRIDAASEVAFLAMDLVYRDAPKLAERFLARYAEEADDFGLYTMVDYYAAYRATVRAKVALLAAIDPGISSAQRHAALQSTHSHLQLAEDFLAPNPLGSLTITCGTVGTGKSTAAREFANASSAVVIRSDLTRKRMAGMREDDRSEASGTAGAGLYSEANKDAVYRALLERAEPVIRSGRHVVLDASYSLRRHRDEVRLWAGARKIETRLLEVRCSEEEARTRLAAREREGSDASDAGPDLQAWSLEHFECPVEWPDDERIVVSTDAPDWRACLREAGEEFVKVGFRAGNETEENRNQGG